MNMSGSWWTNIFTYILKLLTTHAKSSPRPREDFTWAVTMKPEPSETESLYPNQTVWVTIPEHAESIHTQRLYLRPLEFADAGDIFEYRCRQDVADWL